MGPVGMDPFYGSMSAVVYVQSDSGGWRTPTTHPYQPLHSHPAVSHTLP